MRWTRDDEPEPRHSAVPASLGSAAARGGGYVFRGLGISNTDIVTARVISMRLSAVAFFAA
jgi:hypothetical protein